MNIVPNRLSESYEWQWAPLKLNNICWSDIIRAASIEKKKAFEYAQNAKIQIILRMRKV